MQKRKNLLPLSLLLLPALLTAGEKYALPLPPSTTMPTQVITPAVAPEVIDRANITTAGDFLWWGSYMGGLNYAMSGVVDGNPSTAKSLSRGKVKKPPFSWAPGLKVSVGVDYRLDDWNTTATYTVLFNDKEHTSVQRDSTKGLGIDLPVFGIPFEMYATYDATCSWRQNFNVVDVELARNFFISKTLTLRPHGGLKLSWIKEQFHMNYAVNDTTDAFFTNVAMHLQQRQWGIGTRAGLNAVWHFVKEFGLYVDVAATALWSSFRTHLNEIVSTDAPSDFLEPTGTPTAIDTDGRYFFVLPVLELGIGLECTHWFHDDTCLFFAKLGWEEQIWSNFNQFTYPLNNLHGDLSLHGLTLSLGFTF